MATAILIDGSFFLKRFPQVYRRRDAGDPLIVSRTMHEMACAHLHERHTRTPRSLYRIFFYDCPPLTKKAHWPVSRRGIDFSRTETARFRLALHEQLRQMRKVALRLGHLLDGFDWALRPDSLRRVLAGRARFDELTDDDFAVDARQKGVDMRIGLDIAALAYKRLVDQIVLVAGDSDFVPAAKLARREGVDFVLDPMWNHVHASLNEHIDGLRSTSPNPARRATAGDLAALT